MELVQKPCDIECDYCNDVGCDYCTKEVYDFCHICREHTKIVGECVECLGKLCMECIKCKIEPGDIIYTFCYVCYPHSPADPKHILAFDPGTTNFAWAHYKDGLISYSCENVAKHYDSYDTTTDKIVPIIIGQFEKYTKPNLVVVENQFKQKMNCVATIIRTVAKVWGIPFKTIHPNKVKCHFKLPKAPSTLSTKGKHNFNKTVALKYANDNLPDNKKLTDHNCADALLLAIYAHQNKI